ncbi:unnamed protein product [Rhizopus stolonifer]
MYSNILARIAMRSSASRQLVRSDLYHFSNEKGQNLPFCTKNKTALAIKMSLFFGVGFGAPFLSCYWQFYKAG